MIKFLLRLATPTPAANGSTVRHDDVCVVAFPAPNSKGTVDCMAQARAHGIRVLDETVPCSNCGSPLDRKPDYRGEYSTYSERGPNKWLPNRHPHHQASGGKDNSHRS